MTGQGTSALNLFAAALWDAVRRFNDKGGWIMSSHVAMSIMLALFPFILFVVALAGFLSQDLDLNEMTELIFGAWPAEIAGPIENELNRVLASPKSGLITVGGLLTLYFASNGVDAVRVAMSHAYRDTDPRPFWKTRLLCLGFVIAGGALLVALLTVGLALPLYVHFVLDAVPDGIAGWFTDARLNRVLTLLIALIGVGACHVVLPGTVHRLSQIWPGVLLTVLLWALAAQALAIYMTRFANYAATYAGLAGMIAALIFLYLMAAILIFGSEFNGALIKRRGARGGK
ncbi:YihY/virulence factor BrkB family protein [Pukyongiella litopenaei]|uniref:YihY/virulence factor BrkB family protein n=1 Tax=Pukyongiella litopenaei TaxID=2605946 RepID=A0A2S0MU78_9RHOB|nr:YihY/virulence factor BrkB family protein [Pukyongiella litopenaei]